MTNALIIVEVTIVYQNYRAGNPSFDDRDAAPAGAEGAINERDGDSRIAQSQQASGASDAASASTGDAGLVMSTKPTSPSLALVYMSVRPSTVAATISAESPLTLNVATRVKKPAAGCPRLALALFDCVTFEKTRPEIIAAPSSADETLLRDLIKVTSSVG